MKYSPFSIGYVVVEYMSGISSSTDPEFRVPCVFSALPYMLMLSPGLNNIPLIFSETVISLDSSNPLLLDCSPEKEAIIWQLPPNPETRKFPSSVEIWITFSSPALID